MRLGTLSRRHLFNQPITHFAGLLAKLRASEVEPHVRGHVVLHHAVTPRVHEPQVELPAGVALLGSKTVPPNGFNVVLRNTTTSGIHEPQGVLPAGVALLGG